MDKAKASAMIEQQRRRWRSQESNSDLARRARRRFFGVSVMFFFLGFAEVLVAALSGHSAFYFTAAGFLIGGTFFFWQSRRFGDALRVLETQTDTH